MKIKLLLASRTILFSPNSCNYAFALYVPDTHISVYTADIHFHTCEFPYTYNSLYIVNYI